MNDLRGRTVVALHKSGAVFDVHLEVMETFDEKTRRRMFSARMMMDTSASVDRRCIRVTISSADGTIEAIDGLADDLFGLEEDAAKDSGIDELLLWMDGTSTDIFAKVKDLPQWDRNERRAQDAPESPSSRAQTWSLLCGIFKREPNGKLGRLLPVAVESEINSDASVIKLRVWSLEAVEAVIGIDAKGAVTQASQGAEVMFGISAAEFLGSSLSVIMPQMQSQNKWHDRVVARAHTHTRHKMIGATRVVQGVHKTGGPLRLAVSVAQGDKSCPEGTAYVARITISDAAVDLRPDLSTLNASDVGEPGADGAGLSGSHAAEDVTHLSTIYSDGCGNHAGCALRRIDPLLILFRYTARLALSKRKFGTLASRLFLDFHAGCILPLQAWQRFTRPMPAWQR